MADFRLVIRCLEPFDKPATPEALRRAFTSYYDPLADVCSDWELVSVEKEGEHAVQECD